MKHDETIKYLEDRIKKEYNKLLSKEYAVIKDHFEYDIFINSSKIHGECDLIYLDFETRSGYIIEVKHDEHYNCAMKARKQLLKDFLMINQFYTWGLKNGYFVWYYPILDGNKIMNDYDFKVLDNILSRDFLKERLKEYELFFKSIIKTG